MTEVVVDFRGVVEFDIDVPNSFEALGFATVAHGDQMRADGEKYINHPIRVAQSSFVNDDYVLTEKEREISVVAALLHDVVEDTPITIERIEACFGQEVAAVVALVTREDGVTYLDYLNRLIASGNKIALAIKLADLTDNLKTSENLDDPKFEKIRTQRWLPAYDRLVKIWLDLPEQKG